jgi:hypothetical protein
LRCDYSLIFELLRSGILDTGNPEIHSRRMKHAASDRTSNAPHRFQGHKESPGRSLNNSLVEEASLS